MDRKTEMSFGQQQLQIVDGWKDRLMDRQGKIDWQRKWWKMFYPTDDMDRPATNLQTAELPWIYKLVSEQTAWWGCHYCWWILCCPNTDRLVGLSLLLMDTLLSKHWQFGGAVITVDGYSAVPTLTDYLVGLSLLWMDTLLSQHTDRLFGGVVITVDGCPAVPTLTDWWGCHYCGWILCCPNTLTDCLVGLSLLWMDTLLSQHTDGLLGGWTKQRRLDQQTNIWQTDRKRTGKWTQGLNKRWSAKCLPNILIYSNIQWPIQQTVCRMPSWQNSIQLDGHMEEIIAARENGQIQNEWAISLWNTQTKGRKMDGDQTDGQWQHKWMVIREMVIR